VVTSAGDVQGAWEGLVEGESVTITAKDRAGGDVSATIIKHTADTADTFLAKVGEAFNGMVDAAFDGGILKITDRIGGASLLSISGLSVEGVAETMTVSTYGDEGAGVLSVGRNSYFSVENIYMSNSSNTATGFVDGVSFNFHSVSKEENVTVTLERDTEGIRTKFQEMIDAYNAILRYSKSATKVADPTAEDATSGNLAGDSTVRSIASQINNFFHQQFDELNSVYTNFSMLGVKTNTSNGELEIDSEKFNKALTERFDEVVNLFTTVGISDNKNIVLGRSTADTQSGNYVFEEVDATHFRARLEGGTTWYTSEARIGEIIPFETGPLKGLSVTAAAGSIGAGNSATFTMSKGLSTIINDAVDSMTDSHDGIVALRTESYTQSMKRTDDQITRLEERIEKYRLRLVNQFSAMEQALSTMQTQMSNMLSQLGTSSTN
jgi:flagellar hook-associated protein 2